LELLQYSVADQTQVPSTWAGFFESNLVEFLFQLYRVSQGPRCAQVMDCVVCLASVRRSVFRTDEDRDKFMGAMMKGIAEVLVQQIGLADSSNHHSFCRALLRFKVNYQLHQLIGLESYPEWIQQIASFTIHSFRSWQVRRRERVPW
jgi:exportin-7